MLLVSLNDFINFENNMFFTIALIVIIALFIITMIALSIAKNKKKKEGSQNTESVQGGEEMYENLDGSDAEANSLDWESDQALFISSDELMEKDSGYDEIFKDDLFARVTGYSLEDIEDEKKSGSRVPIREYEPVQESDTVSIIMTPIKTQYKKRERTKKTSFPKRLKSSFANDYIYDPTTSTQKGSIIILREADNRYRFRLKTSDGVVVGYSQVFERKITAHNVIKEAIIIADKAEISDLTLQGSIPVIGRPIFEIYKDLEEKFRYKLVSSTGRILFASQGFFKKDNCISAIQAIRDITNLHQMIDDTSVKEDFDKHRNLSDG